MSRRTALGLAAVAGTLTACASPRPAPGAAGRVVAHRFGSTRVPADPGRVVALGVGDTEAAMALGVVPVAGTDVLGLDDLSRPWVREALDGRRPPILLEWRETPFEQIAQLRPDVILYVNSPNDEQVYDTLSAIAPTVAAPEPTGSGTESFGVGWRDQLRVVAAALGREQAGHSVVGAVDQTLVEVRTTHPQLVGPSVIGGLLRPDGLYFWPPRDSRLQLLTELGLRASPALADLDDTGYLLSLSPERYYLLRCDVLYLSALDRDGRVPEQLRPGGLLDQAEPSRRGRVVWAPGPDCYGSPTADGDYAGALALGGALGIPAVVDRLAADVSAVLMR